MSTLSLSREGSNLVKVHDKQQADMLISDGEKKKSAHNPKPPRNANSPVKGQQKRMESTAKSTSQGQSQGHNENRTSAEWLSNKTVGSIQIKTDSEAKKTKKMYDSVLNTEETFIKEMVDLVEHKEMLDLRRREILFKKWSDRVYEPLRNQITTQINGPGYTELQWRKRQLHKDYLEHVNKKTTDNDEGHVFLDTISPDEYFAMALHPTRPGSLVARTESLKDPLLLQDRSRNEEDRVILRCSMGTSFPDNALRHFRLPPLPLVPLGRHGTECATWIAMPMGDIESSVRMASRRRMNSKINVSHFTLDKWGETCPQSVVNREMQIQRKRRHFPTNSVIMSPSPSAHSVHIGIQCEM